MASGCPMIFVMRSAILCATTPASLSWPTHGCWRGSGSPLANAGALSSSQRFLTESEEEVLRIGDAAVLAAALHCVVFDEHGTRRPKRQIRDKSGADAVDAHGPLAHAAPRRGALVPLQRDLRPPRIRGGSRRSATFAFVKFLKLVSHPLRCSVGGCRIHSFSTRR